MPDELFVRRLRQADVCRRVDLEAYLKSRLRFSAMLVSALAALVFASCASEAEHGPIVDNLRWEITTDGEEFFGPSPTEQLCPPPGPECPVPEGDCVELSDYPLCQPTYIAECLTGLTVMAVYTEQCDWITLEQPLLRDIRAGDLIETRTFHFALNLGAEAQLALVIGDWFAFDERLLIPRDSGAVNQVRAAPKDFATGTPVLFHVDNHGSNEYLLVEANVCDPARCTADEP